MILYFSGTGNSAYTAKRIAALTGDECLDLFQRIRDQDCTELYSKRPWVIVTPTYAWRIPRIVTAWLEQAELAGSREVYVVMTCGGNIGNAGAYVEMLCRKRGWNCRGCIPVVMPENYLAMFHTPDRQTSLKIIEKAGKSIEEAAAKIGRGESFPTPSITAADRISSGIVNKLFYPMFVRDKKFFATDACISCGKCEAVCPTRNIRMEQGRPVWNHRCTHCMACICRCPKEAIEYGKKSRGQVRYVCPSDGSDRAAHPDARRG